jgi:cell division protein FtsZ
MPLRIGVPSMPNELRPRITVVGVGGAGGNAVNNMIRAELEGVEFMVANTDSQALTGSLCDRRIQLGSHVTQGLGAGSRPDIGRAAAEEVLDEIIGQLSGSNMVFITAGMGGGTGTGAAPVIARAAREHGILTIGVVTKPFHFEGLHRMRLAESGISDLQQFVDTLIIIPNQNLFRVANEKTTFADAFKMADDVLYSGVRGVTDLMVRPGLINLDFADIRAVMTEMGKAMMGTGEMEGPNRAVASAEAAISNPLLDDVSMKGARALLINITGGDDMTLFELDEAANRIRDEVDPEANIIVGAAFDPTMAGRMRITVVATGIEAEAVTQPKPASLSLVASGGRVVSAAAAAPAPAPAMRAEPVRAAEPMRAPEAHPVHVGAATAMAAMAEHDHHLHRTAEARMEPRATPGRNEALAMEVEDRPFIAPRPIEAPLRQEPIAARSEPLRAPAHAEAEPMEETEPAPAPRARGNIFRRVTGGAAGLMRAGVDLLDRQAEQPVQPQRAKQSPRLAREREALAAEQPAAQPRLSGLDPADRLGGDEDLLDIPAFLRRQAN